MSGRPGGWSLTCRRCRLRSISSQRGRGKGWLDPRGGSAYRVLRKAASVIGKTLKMASKTVVDVLRHTQRSRGEHCWEIFPGVRPPRERLSPLPRCLSGKLRPTSHRAAWSHLTGRPGAQQGRSQALRGRRRLRPCQVPGPSVHKHCNFCFSRSRLVFNL